MDSYTLNAKNIKHALIAQDMTQRELASKLGVNSSWLSHVVNGRKRASEETVARMSHYLKVSFDWLVQVNR